MFSKKQIGQKGEQIASEYLQSHGFTIIERNWITKIGEMDIVAAKDKKIYFVEVKTRLNLDQSDPEDALGKNKIHALHNLVNLYLQTHFEVSQNAALAAICVVLNEDFDLKLIRWYENILE